MILVDTGPLVALFDPTDGFHGRCAEVLGTISEPITTTVPVMTEAFHLLGPASVGSLRLMAFVAEGGLQVLFLDERGLQRSFELMAQYSNVPMDLADASIVTTAERLNLRKVFTIDRNEFATYRIKRGHGHYAFEVVG